MRTFKMFDIEITYDNFGPMNFNEPNDYLRDTGFYLPTIKHMPIFRLLREEAIGNFLVNESYWTAMFMGLNFSALTYMFTATNKFLRENIYIREECYFKLIRIL